MSVRTIYVDKLTYSKNCLILSGSSSECYCIPSKNVILYSETNGRHYNHEYNERKYELELVSGNLIQFYMRKDSPQIMKYLDEFHLSWMKQFETKEDSPIKLNTLYNTISSL